MITIGLVASVNVRKHRISFTTLDYEVDHRQTKLTRILLKTLTANNGN